MREAVVPRFDRFAPQMGDHSGRYNAVEWGVTIELQNPGDAQLFRDIAAHVEHAFADRRRNWRVSTAGSRASENWDRRVEEPSGFERTYTLADSAGEHELRQFAD